MDCYRSVSNLQVRGRENVGKVQSFIITDTVFGNARMHYSLLYFDTRFENTGSKDHKINPPKHASLNRVSLHCSHNYGSECRLENRNRRIYGFRFQAISCCTPFEKSAELNGLINSRHCQRCTKLQSRCHTSAHRLKLWLKAPTN